MLSRVDERYCCDCIYSFALHLEPQLADENGRSEMRHRVDSKVANTEGSSLVASTLERCPSIVNPLKPECIVSTTLFTTR